MAGHKHPNYFKIYLLLLVLFVVSVAGPEVADLLHLQGATRLILILVTAFGIALVKAYYVCAYFMHLKAEKIYAPYILLSCVALMFIFFFGTATDVMKPEGHHWHKPYDEKSAIEEAKARGHHGDEPGEHHESEAVSHEGHAH